MVTVPVIIPVITPLALMVAIEVFDEDQTPPAVAEVNVAVSDTGTIVEPEIAATIGNAFTVIVEVEFEQPVVELVKVNTAVPAETPLTNPALDTVATVLLLLTQVPPVIGVKTIEPLVHTLDVAVTVGIAFTVIVTTLLLSLQTVGDVTLYTLLKLYTPVVNTAVV